MEEIFGDEGSLVVSALLLLVWAGAAGAMLYSLVEMFQISRLTGAAFTRGRVVLRETRNLRRAFAPPTGQRHERRTGRFELTGPDECRFATKQRVGLLGTPFLLAGRIVWSGSSATIEARLAPGLLAFLVLLLLFCSLICLLLLYASLRESPDQWYVPLTFLVGFWLFASVFFLVGVWPAKRRASALIAEIEEYLSAVAA